MSIVGGLRKKAEAEAGFKDPEGKLKEAQKQLPKMKPVGVKVPKESEKPSEKPHKKGKNKKGVKKSKKNKWFSQSFD